jgi:hypothetical protein
MDANEQFSIVSGVRPDAIMTGPLDILMQHVPQSTALVDAEAKLAQVQQEADTQSKSLAHGLQVVTDALQRVADRVTRITGRVDIAVAKKAERQRRDAEAAEAKRVQDLLDSLPDPDDPNAASGDDGDLQAPHHPPDKEHLADYRTESFGDLPDQIKRGAPAPIGSTYEPNIENLTNPQRPPQQPVAISLNSR